MKICVCVCGGGGGGGGGWRGVRRGEVECLEYSSEPQADKHILIYHRLTAVLLLWGGKKKKKVAYPQNLSY